MAQYLSDALFPDAVARGSTGGPMFSTAIVDTVSSKESRNQNWKKARYSYNIGTGIRTRAQMALVIAHFHAVRGRLYSFGFRDWNDFDAANQDMVRIDDTHWQIAKHYVVGASEYVRIITKPVNGSVSVTVSGSPVTPTAIDYLTGIVTFASLPAATPKATFQFYVPVRYDTDTLPVTADSFDIQKVQQINLLSDKESL